MPATDSVIADDGIIMLHLHSLNQLFDSLDPSPFRERDLDPNAEEYIVESVKELPTGTLCTLVVHLDKPIGSEDAGTAVGNAIRTHFARRATILQRNLRQLMRRGVLSLAIGVAFLATVFTLAHGVELWMGSGALTKFVREGFVIAGWVAMWRPLEIFLYDWWPIVGERRINERLSKIEVEIVPAKPNEPLVDAGRV